MFVPVSLGCSEAKQIEADSSAVKLIVFTLAQVPLLEKMATADKEGLQC